MIRRLGSAIAKIPSTSRGQGGQSLLTADFVLAAT